MKLLLLLSIFFIACEPSPQKKKESAAQKQWDTTAHTCVVIKDVIGVQEYVKCVDGGIYLISGWVGKEGDTVDIKGIRLCRRQN